MRASVLAVLLVGCSAPRVASESTSRTEQAIAPPTAKPCPPGAYPGSLCATMWSACASPAYLAVAAVSDPPGSTGFNWRAPAGTIIQINGAPGVGLSSVWNPVTAQLVAAGFRVVQVAGQSASWQTTDAPPSSARTGACRIADIVTWVRAHLHAAPIVDGGAPRGFCAGGSSAGSSALADALTFYASPLDRVVLTNGAPLARIDCGCAPALAGCAPTVANQCAGAADHPVMYPSAFFPSVDAWEGTTSCGDGSASAGDLAHWLADSTLAGDGDLSWGSRATFITCAAPFAAGGEGAMLETVLAGESHACVSCIGEQVFASQAGRDAVTAALLACAP